MSVYATTQSPDILCGELNADFTTASFNSTNVDAGVALGTVLVSALTSLLSLIIVVGNGLIIMSVAVVKKLRQPANYLIVSLALSDFLVGLIVLPLTIVYDIVGEWVFGSMMCDVHVSFDVICCTASIMNLCMISIDRYMMITKPMTYPKRRNGTLMAVLIAAAWLVSCLIIIPALFGFTQNVKDGPGWLNPRHINVIEESDNPVIGPSEINGKFSNGSHSARAALDKNKETFWDPGLRTERNWYFLLDLGQNYRITKISIQNAGDKVHDIVQYVIQTENCSANDEFASVEEQFHVKAGITEAQESQVTGDVTTRYLRMKVNQTYEDYQPKLREFQIFGEKLQGKGCLISQQVWFSIYSTLGAFYFPLGVMLCMYWKIYVEASRFTSRHRTRSASVSESPDFNNTLTSTLDHQSTDANDRASNFFKRAKMKNNDNLDKTTDDMKLQQLQTTEPCLTDSNELLLSNNLKPNSVTVIVTSDYCDKNSDPVFEEETVSSEYEFFASDPVHKNTSDDYIDLDASPKLINESLTNCNGTSGSGREPVVGQVNLQNTSCLSPTNCGANDVCKMPTNNIRTCSDGNLYRRNDNFATIVKSKHGSIGNGLNNGEQRFPTISEDVVFDINDNDSSTSGCSLSRNYTSAVENPESRKRVLYTRSQSCGRRTDEESLNSLQQIYPNSRNSLFSKTASCYSRPILSRTSSSPSPFSSNSLTARKASSRSCSDQRKTSSSRYEQNGGETLPVSNGRRATVFHNIRRRVSMATSRDRMRNVKATRTLGIVVGAFTFCWLPFFTVTFLRPIICDEPESQDCIPLWLVRLVLWLGYLNSALNPLIYIGFSPDLRETFRFLLSCKCTNVDRRLAQTELRHAILREKRVSASNRGALSESIL